MPVIVVPWTYFKKQEVPSFAANSNSNFWNIRAAVLVLRKFYGSSPFNELLDIVGYVCEQHAINLDEEKLRKAFFKEICGNVDPRHAVTIPDQLLVHLREYIRILQMQPDLLSEIDVVEVKKALQQGNSDLAYLWIVQGCEENLAMLTRFFWQRYPHLMSTP